MNFPYSAPRTLLAALLGMGVALSGCGDAPLDDISLDLEAGGDALGGDSFSQGNAQDLARAQDISQDWLAQRLDTWGIPSVDDLAVIDALIDADSMAHVRFQQTIAGVPVFGSEAIVHLNADGSFFALTDTLLSRVSVDPVPGLEAQRAIDRALGAYGCSECLTDVPQVDLQILRREGRDHLTWRIQLRREDGTEDTAMPVYFVDAHTGDVVWTYDNLQTASGTSLYHGNVSINTTSASGTYYLEDIGRKIGTFDCRNSRTSTYRFTDTDDVWNSTSQKAGVDVHFGGEMFMDYWQTVHGRNGIDGSGGPAYYTSINGTTGLISAKVHYGSKYNNAFWNGSYMTYGDGDGTNFSALVSLDIVGHEMMHGITERTANLTYSGESGALNESWSDVFGAMLERYVDGDSAQVWRIGEDVYTPSNGSNDALRYMDNTHQAPNYGYTTDDDPDHYTERYTGSSDNGGVHINSGIPNHVFYLLSQGGTHHKGGSMVGIGADDAQDIWYLALTTYMTSSTNFAGARTATLNAATQLFGASSAQYRAVANAWALCGIGSPATDPDPTPTPAPTPEPTPTPEATPAPTPAPTPTPAPSTERIVNGGFEGGYTPWAGSGNAYYSSTATYAHSGSGYVYLGNTNNASGSLYQDITIPQGASPSLSFWLNVTSNESSTTTAYDKVYAEVRSTGGTLLATLGTWSNKDKASAGAYTLRGSYNLSAWAGQTVRIQFRATTDSSYPSVFRIDDVSVR